MSSTYIAVKIKKKFVLACFRIDLKQNFSEYLYIKTQTFKITIILFSNINL